MMAWLAAMFSFSLTITSLLFLLRVRRAVLAARALMRAEGAPHPALLPLERMVSAAFDWSLLPALRKSELALIELAHREYHDPYQDLAGLLRWIRQNADAERPSQLEEVIKAVCQLAFTLQQPVAALEVCLHPLTDRLRELLTKDRKDVNIVYVRPDELIDTARMLPLNYGPRVRYPLGVIVVERDGRVLSKARVLSA